MFEDARACRRWSRIFVPAACACLVLASPARAALDVDLVEIVKGLARSDGAPLPADGWFAEVCVLGVDIGGATVQPPGGGPLALVEEDPAAEYCLELLFDSAGALDAAFPNGAYPLSIQELGTATTDTITLSLDVSPPDAFADVTSPAHQATGVPFDADLDVAWSYSPAPCGSCVGTGVFLIDAARDADVFESFLSPNLTGIQLPAAVLAPGTDYELEVETAVGSETEAQTDGGDPVTVVRAYVDLNEIVFTTPEPGGGAAALAAGLGLAVCGRGRRRRRARSAAPIC